MMLGMAFSRNTCDLLDWTQRNGLLDKLAALQCYGNLIEFGIHDSMSTPRVRNSGMQIRDTHSIAGDSTIHKTDSS